MGADFPAVGTKAYPENLRENAYILTEELQQLQQSKSFVGSKSMPMQSYKPMVAAMLTYLKKFLTNCDDTKSITSTLAEIQRRVQNTEQQVVFINHKMDNTPRATQPTSRHSLTWAEKLNAAAAAQVPITSTTLTPPSTPIHSLAKAREVICKLFNMNLSNELKQRSPAQLKDRVDASIISSLSGQDINQRTPQIVQARILPSGDLSVTGTKIEDTIALRVDEAWAKHLCTTAKVLRPTYGAVAHGLSKFMDLSPNGMKRVIRQLEEQNDLPIKEGIEYIEWLNKKSSENKMCGSIVLHFRNAIDCNKVLMSNLVWDSRLYSCMRHLPEARMKQYFKCCKYGHMSLACRHDEACFRCAGKHSNKDCGEEPSCAACGGKHTANSEACPARKVERARVNRVKELASPLWPTSSSASLKGPCPNQATVTPAQTATETESSNKENTGMEIVLAEDEAPRRGVSLGPRGQGGEGTWTPVAATKQGDRKKRKRDETMQPKDPNAGAVALITVSRKARKDQVSMHENKENEPISTQVTTRSGRTSIGSAKVRVNEWQHKSTSNPEEEL